LRVRDGPADVHAGAADRGAFRHTLLFLPGPRFDQAVRLGENPRRDDRALPRKVRRRHHREEESRDGAGMPAAGHEEFVGDELRKGASIIDRVSWVNGFVSTGREDCRRKSWVSESTVSPVAKMMVAATAGACFSSRS